MNENQNQRLPNYDHLFHAVPFLIESCSGHCKIVNKKMKMYLSDVLLGSLKLLYPKIECRIISFCEMIVESYRCGGHYWTSWRYQTKISFRYLLIQSILNLRFLCAAIRSSSAETCSFFKCSYWRLKSWNSLIFNCSHSHWDHHQLTCCWDHWTGKMSPTFLRKAWFKVLGALFPLASVIQ